MIANAFVGFGRLLPRVLAIRVSLQIAQFYSYFRIAVGLLRVLAQKFWRENPGIDN